MVKTSLEQAGGRNLERPFQRIQELFDFVGKMRGAQDWRFKYFEGEGVAGAVELPRDFQSLVSEYPDKYFIVGFDDARRDSYREEDLRERYVWLSTVLSRKFSDDRLREITFHEESVSKGNGMFMAITERINQKSMEEDDPDSFDMPVSPWGDSQVTYRIFPNGKKERIALDCTRVDEGMFDWEGGRKPVRWTRRLKVNERDSEKIEYEDFYMVGRTLKGGSKQLVVKTKVQGSLEEPKGIVVEIGSDCGSSRILYDADGIRVVLFDELMGSREIFAQDPTYSFLQESPIDSKKLLSALKMKIEMLQRDWDKPKTVFQGMKSLGV